jgi:hypothetical protein
VANTESLVDPAVSRAKFEREIAEYRRLEAEHVAKGWWVLHTDFPEVRVVFAAPQARPPAVVFGAVLDFTNYDLWAPSVRLVNPFTWQPYHARELPTALPRRVRNDVPPQLAGLAEAFSVQPLMQALSPEDIPFLCIPGVREYHQHPAHSGDSWLLHRGRGEGTLYFLLSQLHKYGVEPIRGYQVGMTITGFNTPEFPE